MHLSGPLRFTFSCSSFVKYLFHHYLKLKGEAPTNYMLAWASDNPGPHHPVLDPIHTLSAPGVQNCSRFPTCPELLPIPRPLHILFPSLELPLCFISIWPAFSPGISHFLFMSIISESPALRLAQTASGGVPLVVHASRSQQILVLCVAHLPVRPGQESWGRASPTSAS